MLTDVSAFSLPRSRLDTAKVPAWVFAKLLILLGLFVSPMVSPTVSYAVPTSLVYTGDLLNPAGQPLTGVMQLQVALHTSPDPGTLDQGSAWGPHVYSGVEVDFGRFSIILGDGEGEDIDAATLASDELWVVFWVNGELLTPFQRVRSMPFAVRSGDADALGGQPATHYVTTEQFQETVTQLQELQTLVEDLQAQIADAKACCDTLASGACLPTTPDGTPCNDTDVCTTGDSCSAGVCSGLLVECDDNNPCTDDFCASGAGCTSSPNASPCSDGSACTIGDICDAGACQPGSALDCDDSNMCTDDGCAPETGCTHSANLLPCDDGDACTMADSCASSACAGVALCDDGDDCTTDVCTDGACDFVGDLSNPACVDWSAQVPAAVICFGESLMGPTLTDDGVLWSQGTATACNGPDSVNNDRAIGIDSLTGSIVGEFVVPSPNSQFIYRDGRITFSTDWNHNSVCGGCQVSYTVPGGVKQWQGGQGPHARGGVSMTMAGVLYNAGSNIIALNANGGQNWSASGTGSGIGAGTWMMRDGSVIGCGTNSSCRRVTASGGSIWQSGLGCGSPQLAMDGNNRIVSVCSPGLVRVYNDGAQQIWASSDLGVSLSSPLVDEENHIWVGTSSGALLRISGDNGAVLATHTVCDGEWVRPWLLTDDGWVLGVCDDLGIVGVTQNGADHLVLASTGPNRWLTLASDGHLVLASGLTAKRLTAGPFTLANAPWPTVDFDLRRTRNPNGL